MDEEEVSCLSQAGPVFVHGVGAMQFERSRTVATAAAAAAAAAATATTVPTLDETNPSKMLPEEGSADAVSPLPRSSHHPSVLEEQTPAAPAEQPPPSHSVPEVGNGEEDAMTTRSQSSQYVTAGKTCQTARWTEAAASAAANAAASNEHRPEPVLHPSPSGALTITREPVRKRVSSVNPKDTPTAEAAPQARRDERLPTTSPASETNSSHRAIRAVFPVRVFAGLVTRNCWCVFDSSQSRETPARVVVLRFSSFSNMCILSWFKHVSRFWSTGRTIITQCSSAERLHQQQQAVVTRLHRCGLPSVVHDSTFCRVSTSLEPDQLGVQTEAAASLFE